MVMSARVLYRIELTRTHRPTGATRHYSDSALLPPPKALTIEQYEGNPGFYLMYRNEANKEQTDTYHETLDDAFAQAEFEFGIKRGEWKDLIGN